ncbi:hypothetical protein [Desertibacillus haloalkaliphilus]|uniref:hypothetical protein n=1 Tax=Desertibacillus haloalkaliphilus TaxID=1328930 RepID=UPI001C2775CA|nr:hypothetical protein [Desertibacillus haloalkaliphilus]MBU8908159.1 hypothetical protein [Desertibacillus haloalkaliphilus]
MSVDFESFNREFFESVEGSQEIHWFNKKGVWSLNEYVNAEIYVITNGVHGTYRGFSVSIIHKTNGCITSHVFLFDEYMKKRDDERNDYNGGFSIVEDCCRQGTADWYIARPSVREVEAMAHQINVYLNFWR